MGCRACCSRSEHPPLAGTPFPTETGICCFPGSKGELVQSGFGWEISKLCCSEPVSSLPSFPGDGAPVHTREIGLPRAEMRIAGLQNPVSSAFLAPRCSWELREGFAFFFSDSAGQTPPLGRFQRDGKLHLVIRRTCLAPRAWSKIRNLTHCFCNTLTRLQEFPHSQSLL